MSRLDRSGVIGAQVAVANREWRLPVKVEDVHLLVLHEPYESAEHPVPIDATIVHALTLLHPLVPQPDGGRMYRCLTEFPSRTPGCLVPLSTLTYELDGGRLWPQVANWQAVTDAVVRLSRTGACDAIPLGLPPVAAALLGSGPTTTVTVHRPDGGRRVIGGPERQDYINELAGTVRSFVARGPFYPGDGLTDPSVQPEAMPYKPYDQ
jgi:hypothetical protein